ncbi:iron(III) transport system permease protein [Thermosyntropha lipolytica DSM 11003]|uniref:Iron(III) transport system permease protein n=2 Tax=Thermosyntropha TaxID=54293 RepID=A0A1M5K2Z4_9FIRM|nr:iron(III) transport system permease protein [Thermosyntropha lipolytica DSM 11003]
MNGDEKSYDGQIVRTEAEKRLYIAITILGLGLILISVLFMIGEAFFINASLIEILSWQKRIVILLVRTITLAISASATALIFGFILAAAMRFWPAGQKVLFLLLLLAFPIPPYVHTAGWSLALQALGASGYGILVAWWCMTVSLLSFSALISYAILNSIDEEILEAAALGANGPHCLVQVILPLAMPLLVASFLFIFCLNLMDYTIPSLCQVNVYSLHLFADFSIFAQAGRTLLLSLPLFLAGLPLLLLAGRGMKKFGVTIRTGQRSELNLEWPASYKIAAGFSFLVFISVLGIPLVNLIIQVWTSGITVHLFNFGTSLAYSLIIAAFVAMLSVLIGYPVAVLISEYPRWGTILWPLLLLPWLIPASLNGAGWIAAAQTIPYFSGTSLLLILGELARFLSVAVLLIWGFYLRLDYEVVNAGRLFSPCWLYALWKVELPLLAPGILAGSLIVAALTLGELGTTILLVPPGFETLTLRIYNYMHYGAHDHVAAACLAMMILTMFLGWAAAVSLRISRAGN